MTQKKKKLIIIDGHALIFRAWYALPPLKTRSGLVINAAYGFTSTLLKAVKDFKPDYMVVTLDEKGPTFRHKSYKEYKSQREEQPEEFHKQLPCIKEILKSLSITTLSKKGYEADDIIGSIVKRYHNTPDLEIDIITKDFDIFQLVNDTVKVIALEKGISEFKVFDNHAVKEKYDLLPKQLIDYKALKGDPSDNVKGVPGVGDKTALSLIKEFGSLKNLYDRLPKAKKINNTLKEKLLQHEKDARLSKKLVTIDCHIPIKKSLKDLALKPINTNKAFKLFSELEFRTLLPRLRDLQYKPLPATADKTTYEMPASDNALKKFLNILKKQKIIALDTETTGLDVLLNELVGISFSWKEKTGWWLDKPAINRFKKEVDAILSNPKIKKVGHNIKFDLGILDKEGFSLNGIAFDTMIAAYLISPGGRNYTLANQVFIEFGHRMTPITELIGEGKNQISMAKVSQKRLVPYASADADYTWRLYQKLHKRISERGVNLVFNRLEIPLIEVLHSMEKAGVKIDTKEIAKVDDLISKKIDDTTKIIYSLAGKKFNISSPIQLKEILFSRLKIPANTLRSTKTGLSTAASELNKLKGLHPIIDEIINYRELTKLKNTYLEPLPKLINLKTGRVHTTYNQTITVTGRLSSSNPNLQNIPIRTELGNRIRKAFVAEKGSVLLAADYSQIELRIAAHLSKDRNMTKAFQNDTDIHRQTASFINQVPENKVTETMRSAAKEVNFGVLYGMNAYGIATRTGVTPTTAQQFLDRYFYKYDQLKKYRDDLIEKARKSGYAESITGRKRYLPDLGSKNFALRNAAERMAINMPIQGSQADIIKIAMIECYNKLVKKYPGLKLILQVHDELVFEALQKDITVIAPQIKTIMSSAYKLSIPLKVKLEVGKNWQEMEEFIT